MGAATNLGVAPTYESGRDERLDPLGEFATRLIRRKAKQLCRRLGFNRSDRPDLEQELALIVLRRAADFEPRRSHYNAFVTTVVERYTATIIERHEAWKRTYRRDGGSLHISVDVADGGAMELLATLSTTEQSRHTGQRRRPPEDAWNLTEDVASVIRDMPPLMRRVCELLMSDSKKAAAHELGLSQYALYETLQRILARFEKAGLRDYLR
jgi:DNA-directed RNA polymerase specialized sigma24 family protein